MKYIKLLSIVALSLAMAGCSVETSDGPQSQSNAGTGIDIAKITSWPSDEIERSSIGSGVMDNNDGDRLVRNNVIIVLDNSGSMSDAQCSGSFPNKSLAAESAIMEHLTTADPNTNYGLVTFDENGINVSVPLQPLNPTAFRIALDKSSPAGGTPLRQAISLGYDELLTQGSLQRGIGTYQIMVVTDGEVQSRNDDPSPLIRRLVNETPVGIIAAGFCISGSHSLNDPDRVTYSEAKRVEDLTRAFEELSAESDIFGIDQSTF